MANPNEDIDDILRAAMKTLDGETPAGYFEGLPNRTLARLEGSMQTTSGNESASSSKELPMTDSGNGREEDSGLHDIRNLAAASRSRRMSSSRIGTTPPADEDLLASASGSWKSIALPEPAKMISLPEIAALPSKADLKAQEKADKAAAKASRKSRPSGELAVEPAARTSVQELAAAPVVSITTPDVVAKTSEPPLHLDDEPLSGTAKGATTAAVGTAKGASVAPIFGSRIAEQKKSRGALYAAVGVALAAAAGVAIYLGTRGGDAKPTQAAAIEPAPVKTEPAKPTAAPIEQPAAVAKEEPKEEPKPEPQPEPVVPVEPPSNAKTVAKPAKPTKKPDKQVIEVQDPGNGVKAVKKDEPKKEEPKKEGDPDFEQLLKDSGYQKKEADKPKLEKKSLAAGDFKAGMAGISGKAQGCYKGTQGTAMVKLTIAPSGSVSKVSVTGVGAAEAACVQAAVQGASFPAWDGGPQSFNYSYLLSE